MPKDYPKIRRAMQDAQEKALELIPRITMEWKRRFGTYHGDFFEFYRCEDANHVVVAVGALGSESKVAIDELRAKGKKVGLARLRVLRPFPKREVVELARHSDLIVIDRNISVGMEGVFFSEIKSALYGNAEAKVYGFVAGLGGKDVTYKDIERICEKVIGGRYKKYEWYDLER
jgi:pyruvate/2-oxoacid:ferredoxin oxidoreductase alpha subunit